MSPTALDLRIEELDWKIAQSRAPREFRREWAIFRGRWTEAFDTLGDTMPINRLADSKKQFEGLAARFALGSEGQTSQSSTGLIAAGALALLTIGGVAIAASGDDEDGDSGGEGEG